jgi:hypothetical protein
MKNGLLLGFGTIVVSLIAVIGLSRAQGLELHSQIRVCANNGRPT